MREKREEEVLTYLKPKINYIPDNLNLEEWAANQKLYGFTKFSKDVCATLISPIYTIPVYNKVFRDEIKDNPESFISLSSKIMYRVDKQYRKYIKLLIEGDILECDDSYSTGSSCKGYRFTEAYANQPYKKYLNYKDGKQVTENQNNTSSLVLNYYTSTVTALIENLDKVQLDYDSSMNSLKTAYQHNLITTTEYNSAGISLEKINNKEFFATQDDYGRLHTNFVNLKKEYRNYLTTNTGEELVSIDIKNCQPFLTTLLLKSSFWEGSSAGSVETLNIDDIKPKIIKLLQETDAIQTLIMFTKSVEDNVDIFKYKNLVLSGYLYEFLLDEFRSDGIKCFNRKAAKEEVYKVFFSKNFHLRTSKTAKIFKELFPSVYKLFCLIKKKHHNLLATLLQAIESQIVIEGVVKSFMQEDPDSPLLTIHDSVVVPISKTLKMKNIMLDYITEKVGFQPAVSVEVLKPPKDDTAVAA
ncbi:MAG TPA: hypothetical protein VNI52_00450 [Sphingobacteriaceae bacterium]|nr:hypothetical protein [Sphingobacteriaceae bacterium]